MNKILLFIKESGMYEKILYATLSVLTIGLLVNFLVYPVLSMGAINYAMARNYNPVYGYIFDAFMFLLLLSFLKMAIYLIYLLLVKRWAHFFIFLGIYFLILVGAWWAIVFPSIHSPTMPSVSILVGAWWAIVFPSIHV